jgi:hypothetical protein
MTTEEELRARKERTSQVESVRRKGRTNPYTDELAKAGANFKEGEAGVEDARGGEKSVSAVVALYDEVIWRAWAKEWSEGTKGGRLR